MRCFIAIDLPGELKSRIGNFIDGFAAPLLDIRWVPQKNLHLTLKFLGDIKEDVIVNIGRSLRDVCRKHSPFTISFQGTGVFPNHKNPNVLWIGVKTSEELRNLFTDIEEDLFKLGFEKENRKHSPHLTIGRVKNRENLSSVMKSLDEFRKQYFGTLLVTEIHLMKSTLKTSGAEYSNLASFKLKGEHSDRG